MHIIINGESHSLDQDCTLTQLIAIQQLEGKRIAIEVNEDLIPRSQFDLHRLRDGDRVEIVQAIGGG